MTPSIAPMPTRKPNAPPHGRKKPEPKAQAERESRKQAVMDDDQWEFLDGIAGKNGTDPVYRGRYVSYMVRLAVEEWIKRYKAGRGD